MQADTLVQPHFATSEVGTPSGLSLSSNDSRVQESPSVQNIQIDDPESVTRRIAALSEFEKATAKNYGMSNIDHVAILQRAKKEAMSALESSEHAKEKKVETAETLQTLFKLRHARTHKRHGPPRSDSSTPDLSITKHDYKPLASQDGSQFWAVIIGIDDYHHSPLRGCVSDAKIIARYLVDDLKVPGSHIYPLLAPTDKSDCRGFPDVLSNTFPSRKNIVHTLFGLRSNPLIQPGDNIIVYFGGHGSSYHCSEYFSGDCSDIGAIEAICPADRDTSGCTDISDRELNSILALVAEKKGRNITVIADCCYANSLTRAPSAPWPLPSGVGAPRTLSALPSLNQNVSNLEFMLRAGDRILLDYAPNAIPSILAPNWFPDMSTHVLLAACQDYELAREVQNKDGTSNGIFTKALVRALKSPASESCTYEGLCTTLTIPAWAEQTPHASGHHTCTYLWANRMSI